jgi:hypothetical protein
VEAARAGAWSTAALLALYVAGFAWVGALSLAHARRRAAPRGCEPARAPLYSHTP